MCLKLILSEMCIISCYHMWPQKEAFQLFSTFWSAFISWSLGYFPFTTRTAKNLLCSSGFITSRKFPPDQMSTDSQWDIGHSQSNKCVYLTISTNDWGLQAKGRRKPQSYFSPQSPNWSKERIRLCRPPTNEAFYILTQKCMTEALRS